MSKSPTHVLRRAGGRAKSDVANKLVSMCLHIVSKTLCEQGGLRVESEDYRHAVAGAFGDACAYCGCDLHGATVAIEHLDAMNRLRLGLHVPGNVLLSCRECNNAKRRSDGAQTLKFGTSGWNDFLSHDSRECDPTCVACGYWRKLLPPDRVVEHLSRRRDDISAFREKYVDQYPSTLPPELFSLVSEIYSAAQAEAQVAAGKVHAKWKALSQNESA